jgi:preprotein translocase subunit SecA
LFGSERIASIMDRLGMKEGEDIQHSMITRNIERAQRKVEQNNFGIRKRLLEYDDVMNSQREVIYSKRRNALYGDKLELDVSNMMADLAQELVETYQDAKNYAEFRFEVLRLLAYEPKMQESDFLGQNTDRVSQMLFDELHDHYRQKSNQIAKNAFPIIRDIYTNSGNYEMIVVPFSDGLRTMQVSVNLKKAFDTEGREIARTFEKFAMLFVIDEEWKEHLREMDELKQSAQNASYEQKDPLLIYKLESFNLFKSLVSRVNRDVLSMLFKGTIPVQQAGNVQEAKKPLPYQQPKLQTSRTDDVSEALANQRAAAQQQTSEAVKQQQIKNTVKIGRNDPCPCGSGKKFKNCHGRDEA